MTTGSVTRQLAEVLAATTPGDLPADVREHTRRSILDWLGSALAGSRQRPARLVQQVAAGLGASDEASIFGAGRASAAVAAFANGAASHILELDDIHKSSTVHGAAPIISAALAVAERQRAGGAAFMTAVTVGYEAALRIGDAVNPSHYRFWHPTGTAATFGAAAAAGSLMGFDADRMQQALGSAGTQAAGLWEFNADGAMSKHLHPAKAAFNGILAADLARVGFTGASRILEGERGFFRATAASHDETRITDGLGRAWKIGENCYKVHACCAHTHAAIDLAIDQGAALRDGARLADVAGIHVEAYGPGYEIVKESQPRTPYQGKFSMAYCVVTGLIEGRVGLQQFSVERFGPDGVREPLAATLLARTRVTVADDLTRKYPGAWPARLTVTLTDGSAQTTESEYPRGNPENPVSTAALEDKFLGLVAPVLGDRDARSALDAVRDLDSCSDLAALFRRLPVSEAVSHS